MLRRIAICLTPSEFADIRAMSRFKGFLNPGTWARMVVLDTLKIEQRKGELIDGRAEQTSLFPDTTRKRPVVIRSRRGYGA